MEVNIKLDQSDWNALYDITLGALKRKVDDEELKFIWFSFDNSLKGQVAQHGLSDSVVRDNIYKYLENDYKTPVVEKNFLEDYDFESINGHEIIDFLNKEYLENDDLCDISITHFTFDSQEVKKGQYVLQFTGTYNNWGTDQEYGGNTIRIKKSGIQLRFDELFEGDGTDDAIEEVLLPWLEKHTFDGNQEDVFHSIVTPAIEDLIKVGFSDKKELQRVIEELVKAKTYMK